MRTLDADAVFFLFFLLKSLSDVDFGWCLCVCVSGRDIPPPPKPLQHRLGHDPTRLPHPQVRQNLLCAAQNRIKLVRPVELLHHLPHAPLRQTSPPKHIHRIVRDLVRAPRRIRLQQRDRAPQMLVLLRVTQATHLMRDRLEPRLRRLGQHDHAGELGANDGLLDERAGEDEALVRPLEAFLGDGAEPADGTAGHGPALVVEVGEDDLEATVLRAEDVGCGHVDVVELDVGGTGGGGVGCLFCVSVGSSVLGARVLIGDEGEEGDRGVMVLREYY